MEGIDEQAVGPCTFLVLFTFLDIDQCTGIPNTLRHLVISQLAHAQTVSNSEELFLRGRSHRILGCS